MKLTEAEYWEWRTTVAEMNLADEMAKHAATQMELSILKSKVQVKGLQNKSQEAHLEFDKFKVKLETRLGVSLNGKIITEDFELKEME